MKHYISICRQRGTNCNEAVKAPLEECLTYVCQVENARKHKLDNYLLFPAYSHDKEEYSRRESQVDRFSIIVLDCDNDQKDPMAIEKFKNQMKLYNYLIYETYSSTKEQPKFRAIIPLDDELVWSSAAKKAIFERFKEIADAKASWFFSPDLGHVGTIYEHEGIEYSASSLLQDIRRIEDSQKLDDELFRLKSRLYSSRNQYRPRDETGWRFLPSVKKCLDGLHQGERDSSLNAACYAMDKNGYRDHIREFLDEVYCDRNVKEKFYRKYR